MTQGQSTAPDHPWQDTPGPGQPGPGRAGNDDRPATDWAAYVSAAQRLGAVRQAERDRSGERHRTVAAAGEQLAELSVQAMAQQADLTELAGKLRLPAPSFPPAARGEVTGPLGLDSAASPTDRLARAGQCLHEANLAADAAEDAGRQPVLLPNLGPRARNAVVYAGCSLLGLAAQLVMIGLYSQKLVTDQVSMYAWTCCGFPALAFFAGYLVIGVVCQSRMSTQPVDRSVRMGALICAASLPVYTIVLGMVGQLL
jgi:hypothetical protein